MERILIVDDDGNINELLKDALTREGWECGQAFSGTEAMLRLQMEDYDLVLLDLSLPGLSGEEIIAKLREKRSIPVIVVSAKDDLDSKVDVLSLGADDYVTKPFQIKEVAARIRVQLRKSAAVPDAKMIRHRAMEMDMTQHTVTINGTEVPKLTRQEFRVLELLMENPTRVFSKDAIFEYAWQEPYVGETKTIDVHISNLRKKLHQVCDDDYIETVWGIGYRLR